MSLSGRYELREPLARGGMGEVWLATLRGSAGFEKRVVVKRVLSHLDDDPEFLARFIDEARIAATLSHANIVSVFDLGEDQEGFYLAMEWVDGWDLRKILRTLAAEDERMPEELAVFVAAEVAGALAYAHSRTDDQGASLHIVHRDVSPSNILVSRAGEVKLTDFGIASARSRLGHTATGQLRGKFAYMSPEQATGAPVDGRSDVFVLGAVLFELLAGRKAFDGDGDIATLDRVRRGERPLLDELRPDLPAALVGVVERAMAMEPADRFADAAELEARLREELVGTWGAVGRPQLAAWLLGRLAGDPLFRAQDRPGGASLDDILAAQLDGVRGNSITATGSGGSVNRSATRSASRSGMILSTSRALRPAPTPPGGHTLTHAALPRSRRPPARLWAAAVATVVLGCAMAAIVFWPKPPRAVVHSEPPGAQVYVDGVPVGVSDLTIRVTPGEHEVRLSMPGFQPAVRPITVRRGDSVALDVALVPDDRVVAFHSVPAGAVVTVGDTEIVAGNTVPVPIGVPVSVRMELEGYAPVVEEVVFDETDTVLTRRLRPLLAAAGPAGGPDIAPDEDPPTARDEPEPRTDPSPPPTRGRRDAGHADTGTPPPTGTVVLRFTDPPLVGDITIDGRAHGSNEDVRMEFQLTAGEHTIGVVNTAAGVRFEAGVEVEPGAEQAVTVQWSDDG